MNIQEIKEAVDAGRTVCWVHTGYEVIKDNIDQYMIKCNLNGHLIGLTNLAGDRLNGQETEFFILEEKSSQNDFNTDSKSIVLSVKTISEALVPPFWQDPHKERIINEAVKAGMMRRHSVTQAEWCEEALKELALGELAYLYSDQTLFEELYRRGWYGLLFRVEDVLNVLNIMNEENGTKYSLTHKECTETLEYAFGKYSDYDIFADILKYEIRRTLGIEEDD